ncbi:hypothetical protein D3C85_934860 [compost metagenome]
MYQHLVHHHLEEQRRQQRENLQDERHQQHFAEQLAVFDDGRDEPAEVELAQLAGQRGLGADQDQFAGPTCEQLIEAKHFRTLSLGIMDQYFAVIQARDDKEASVLRGGNRR